MKKIDIEKIRNIKKKINSKSNIIIAICIIICSIIILMPILNIAKYNMPSADDYSYSKEPHLVWENTHNAFKVINQALDNVKNTYKGWQGTYSAIFLFSMQPSLFGVEYYRICTFILLGMLIISNLYLVKTIAKKCFNYKKNSIIFILALVPTVLEVQLVPEPKQSLFWWNGSVYYTFFFSFMLIAIAYIINIIKSEKKGSLITYSILAILFTILIGGSNYPTALIYCMILALTTLFLFINKKTKKSKKFILLGITILAAVSLLISMVAPGNAVRQANCDNSLGAVGAIIKAIKAGVKYVISWTNVTVIATFIFLVPFIYEVIKNSKFKFRYPIIFSIITFGILCAMFVPPLYAMNNYGEGRLINIIYYSYYWLMILNIAYYLGWIKNKFDDKENSSIKLMDYINENILIFSIIMAILIVLICYVTESYKSFTSYKAYDSLSKNEAQDYYQEMLQRYEVLENKEIKDVAFNELKNHPELLFYVEFNVDKNDWINSDASIYFEKNSIYLVKNTEEIEDESK